MALPIGTALLGLAVGVSSMSLIAYVIDIPSWAPVLGAMVGLGVGIDYALFIVTRHRELPRSRAALSRSRSAAAVATAGKPVVFAGGIVVVAILGLAVAGVPFMTAGGIAISVVVLVMVVASVTLLPALLGPGRAPDQPAGRAVRPRQRRRSGQPGWPRWVGHVDPQPVAVRGRRHRAAARPRRAGAGAARRHPRRRRAARAAGPSAGPTTWWPRGSARAATGRWSSPSTSPATRPCSTRWSTAVRADPGIASVGAPEVHADAGVAVVVAIPTTGPQDAATHDDGRAAARRRAAQRCSAGSPAQAHVGGQTANFADVGAPRQRTAARCSSPRCSRCPSCC